MRSISRGISLTLVLVLVAFALAGCASSRGVNVDDIPGFYLNPPTAEDAIYGVGDAKMSSLSMSRTMAFSRARDDVARQVEVAVKNAITDYAQEAGEGDNTQAVQFAETVSRQLVDVTLRGVKQVEAHVGKDGTVYAMVEYPMSSFMSEAEAAFERNQASAFAEFKAAQALEQLNFELENNPPKAGGGN